MSEKQQAIQTVQVITAADLEENGGSYVILGNQAIQVQGYTAQGSKSVKGGSALPVYVVSDAELAAGRFLVIQDAAIPVGQLSDLGASRPVRGKAALPVFPVNSWPVSDVAFSPPDLSGLLLWFDISDITSLYQDSAKTTPVTSTGDPIGAAVDLSGNGDDALQAITANKPTYRTSVQNGLSVTQCDGGDELRTAGDVSAGTDETIFSVAANAADPLTGTICGYTSTNRLFYASVLNRITYRYNSSSLNFGGHIQTNWHYIAGSHTGGVSRMFVDGVERLPTGAVADAIRTARFSIGSRGTADFLTGDIGEIIVYSRALTDSERQQVEAYLASKWGI